MASLISPRGKVIRDPIHGLIGLHPGEEYLLDLIACPEFQRLRRVRQLGVSNITYPGAEHTRFAHSLGVLNFASRILNRLKERYSKHQEVLSLITDNERIIKAAALLHDTGHGPFSHMIERAFKANAKHEDRTADIITGTDSQVRVKLLQHGIEPDKVRAVIDGLFPIWFLRDIVSSQLDADRMDYLIRDARMIGVEYGHYDAEWIINALCLGRDPISHEKDNPAHLRLCLDRSRGLHAAEQLVVARMHMSYQVYFHRVTRSWEAHLLCLFNIARELATTETLPGGTPEVVERFFAGNGVLNHANFLQFDEAAMIAAFHAWSRASGDGLVSRIRELASAFLCREKVFFSKDDAADNPLEDSFRKVRALEKAGAVERIDFYHDEAKFRGYKDFGRSLAGAENEDNEQTTGSEAIFLSDGDPREKARPVEQDDRALITPALAEKKAAPLNRVFIHRNFKDGF